MSSSVSWLVPVTSAYVDIIWWMVDDLLTKACKKTNGRMPVEVLKQTIKEQKMQLWLSFNIDMEVECACVTEIIDYPGKKVCRIVIGTGERFLHWVGHMDEIEKWAKELGCTGMESIARKGWARILASWKQTHVFIEKEI